MKLVKWNLEKSKMLKEIRGIELERIAVLIEENQYLDIRQVPSRPDQMMFLVDYDEYIVCVPFVESENEIFIKTAYRSRKANKVVKG